MRRVLVPVLVALTGLAGVSSASADGLPVLGVDVGTQGAVAHPDAAYRYVAVNVDGDRTLVARTETDGGRVDNAVVLDERLTIPAVAYDGSSGGVSRDGRTVVLLRPRARFPQRSTRLVVLHGNLSLRSALELDGDFSFDAISPDGRSLYLVQYLSPRDPTKYLVRLYDLRERRLLPEPIIDPREVGDVMRGEPVTRETGADGRWAYTLYAAPGGHHFVHALDTVGRTALCIDLHELSARDDVIALRLRLSDDGKRLNVTNANETVVAIDVATHEVVAEAAVASSPPASEVAEGVTAAWALLALPGLALAGGGMALRRRRR